MLSPRLTPKEERAFQMHSPFAILSGEPSVIPAVR